MLLFLHGVGALHIIPGRFLWWICWVFVIMLQIQGTHVPLYSKSYLLQGGTPIPSRADMNNYNTPGNYYCPNNDTAATLLNCPFSNAFILKVEYGTGTTYPSQTFTELYSRRIATRYRGLSEGSWQPYVYFSDDAALADNLLSTAPYTVTFDEIAPGAAQTKNVSVHRDGHKPIGCVGWANTKSSDFYLYQCSVNNSEILLAFVKSTADSTIPAGASVIVNVLFVKNS